MRSSSWVFIAAAALAACTSSPDPQRITAATTALASETSDAAPPIVYNTQMRSDIEVPACVSDSKGHAQIKIFQDGTIESQVIIENKSDESIRFWHIHHLAAGAATGPIIWWLTTPVGKNLLLTDRHIDMRQAGVFVPNPDFASADAALTALLDDPGSFYVNFHSNHCPAGVARGFLP